MINCIAIDKLVNNSGITTGYILKDDQGNTTQMASEEIKKSIHSKKISVENLKITSDNKLILITSRKPSEIFNGKVGNWALTCSSDIYFAAKHIPTGVIYHLQVEDPYQDKTRYIIVSDSRRKERILEKGNIDRRFLVYISRVGTKQDMVHLANNLDALLTDYTLYTDDDFYKLLKPRESSLRDDLSGDYMDALMANRRLGFIDDYEKEHNIGKYAPVVATPEPQVISVPEKQIETNSGLTPQELEEYVKLKSQEDSLRYDLKTGDQYDKQDALFNLKKIWKFEEKLSDKPTVKETVDYKKLKTNQADYEDDIKGGDSHTCADAYYALKKIKEFERKYGITV